MERAPGMPSDVVAAWQTIERGVADGTIATERGIPVLSRHGAVWNVAWFALQSLVTAAAAVVNLPPLLAAWLAGRRLADARTPSRSGVSWSARQPPYCGRWAC